MKKTITEKTNKMYLLILCGLLVSGAIVCSTNNNGGSDNGNGDGNGDPLMFSCRNGTAVTPTANNMPTMNNEVNCASCNTNFTQTAASRSGRATCEPNQSINAFVCPNGLIANGTSDTAGVENCASCTTAGFTLEAVQGSDRMVCSANGNGDPLMFTCPNGTAVTSTADNMPTMANVENCDSCDPGFGEVTQGALTICQPKYVCPNGTPANGTTAMANVENCASCTTPAFTLEAAGSEMVCRTPYVCLNGTPASGTTTTANVENCASCDDGFGTPQSSGSESTCSGNDLPIALWNAGTHDGDFGVAFCQNIIAQSYTGSDAAVTAQRSSAIATDLRRRGYTKAVFFGSTGNTQSRYIFTNIGSDPDALGDNGDVSDRNIVVFTESGNTVSITHTFGDTNPVARTLDNVTDVAEGSGWQTGGDDVVAVAGVTGTSASNTANTWSFTGGQGTISLNHCFVDDISTGFPRGSLMNLDSADGHTDADTDRTELCTSLQSVLCIAR